MEVSPGNETLSRVVALPSILNTLIIISLHVENTKKNNIIEIYESLISRMKHNGIFKHIAYMNNMFEQ